MSEDLRLQGSYREADKSRKRLLNYYETDKLPSVKGTRTTIAEETVIRYNGCDIRIRVFTIRNGSAFVVEDNSPATLRVFVESRNGHPTDDISNTVSKLLKKQ